MYKSILIEEEVHEEIKEFSRKSGMKIRFITEEAIKEFISKWSEDNGSIETII